MGGAGVDVVQDAMAVVEGPPSGILPREAHRYAFVKQGCVCQGLGIAPVEAFAVHHRFKAFVDQGLNLGVRGETGRQFHQGLGKGQQFVPRNAGFAACGAILTADVAPLLSKTDLRCLRLRLQGAVEAVLNTLLDTCQL